MTRRRLIGRPDAQTVRLKGSQFHGRRVSDRGEVAAIAADRSGARRLDLHPIAEPLPRFKAGAHIDLFLANGMIRSYSLMNDEAEVDRYLIGVGRDRQSRGGSAFVHDHVVEGGELTISPPTNLFPLEEAASRTVMVAGGIGVTPFLGMIARLEALGRDWHLHSCARSRALAPFADALGLYGARVTMRYADDTPRDYLDMAAMVAGEPANTHFYCCGPARMIEAFERAMTGIDPRQVHIERFASDEVPATEGGFTVELARSGRSVRVDAGRTILEALQAADIDVPFSCLSGVCGSCRTAVLEGTPDHRDLILTNREKRRNDQMMICCSGSLGERIVLDL